MSVNRNVDNVIASCLEQHKPCWLYPPLRNAISDLCSNKFQLPNKCPVKVISIELWDTKRLVAGELGYIVGTVYTSLTGFCIKHDHSGEKKGNVAYGTVQLYALAGLLKKIGCGMWDLGMFIEYKGSMGAENIPRDQFVNRLRTCRDDLTVLENKFFESIIANSTQLDAMELIKPLTSQPKQQQQQDNPVL